MTRFAHGLALVASLVSLIGMLGCGSGRHLESIALSPATARAQGSFTATGIFNQKPSPVQLTSKDVQWCIGSTMGACVGNINPGATVDQNGQAHCLQGFSGTVTVLAGTTTMTMGNPDGSQQLDIFGTATLSCP